MTPSVSRVRRQLPDLRDARPAAAGGPDHRQPAAGGMKAPGVKQIAIRDGKYKLWTQKVGNGNIKLLLLHGGPGTSPEYFENFPLYLKDNYTIYYYSQLGTYLSDQPSDTSLASVPKFAEDVEEVSTDFKVGSFTEKSW